MFAVVVTLELVPGSTGDFLPLMRENAKASLRDEPGCHQFDVSTDPARPEEVLLYELYVDAAAFDTHLTTAHFAAFDTATSKMIKHKTVKTYSDVEQ